jgi:gamma-glutamyltranspeptidase/glutathione hydrolase
MTSGQAGVAAGHDETAEAAALILRDGGNAVDAAIAALWMACVCEPVLASPGGGGFALIGGKPLFKPVCLDFFVQTPAQKQGDGLQGLHEIYADFGPSRQAFHIGPGSMAVPGYVQGLFALHQRFGSRPMPVLAEPAIEKAKEGIALTAFQARLFKIVAPILTHTLEGRSLFCAPDEKLRAEGTLFCNPHLSDVLDCLSREGEKLFTHGEIAARLVKASDGLMTREDLAGYHVIWREPLHFALKEGWSVFTNPAPAAGGSLVRESLALYEQWQPSAFARQHQMDVIRFADSFEALDKDWKKQGKPADYRYNQPSRQPLSTVVQRGTTHISLCDNKGLCVSVTVSNGEGSGVMIPGCGFMVNNMLGEDDLMPGGPGSWLPGQRLSSMMAPTLASQGPAHWLACGSGGSNRIRSSMAQTLLRHLIYKEPLEEAIHKPRLHVENGFLDVEDSMDEDLLHALCKRFEGHKIWTGEPSMFFGGVHALDCSEKGAVQGAGDPRRSGVFIRTQ